MKNRLRILFSVLVTLLLLSVLSAGTFPVSAATNFTVTPETVVYSMVQGNSVSKQLTLTNTSGGTIQITSVTLGGNKPGSYSINGLPATPFNLGPGESDNFNVVFATGSAGVSLAKLTISAGGDTAVVELRGLATLGTGGSNEPSLARIMTTFFGDVDTGISNLEPGDDDPATTSIHSVYGGYAPLLGDEIPAQTMVRADTSAPVTLQVIAAYGNNSNPVARWGYYQPGNTSNRTEVFTVNNSPSSNAQTLNPTTSGTLSFVPSFEPFGLYTIWPSFSNREVYSEDVFNTWEPDSGERHKVRIFPIPGEANAYLFTTDEYIQQPFDYNDVVVIMRNVKPSGTPLSMLRFENPDWQQLIALGQKNTDWLNTWLTFSGLKAHLLTPNPFYPQHREIPLRIHNRSSTATLTIDSIVFSEPTKWKAKNNETNIAIPPLGHYDFVVKFIEQEGDKGERYGTITFTTNDPQNPTALVNLAAGYQVEVESSNELDLPQMVPTFGYGIHLANPNNGNYVAFGEEILSKNWQRADTGKPIYVMYLAALHGLGTASVKLDFASSSDSSLTHDGAHYQTYFPFKSGSNTLAEMNITGKNDTFFFNIAGKTACSSSCTNQHGIRVWRARDPQGRPMTDTYLVAQDYVGSGSSTNYDWNDNLVLVSNIKPVTTYLPDPKVDATPIPANIKVGQTATAQFRVFNKFGFAADGVTFTVTVPANATYLSHTNPACTYAAPTLTCNFGDEFFANEPHPEVVTIDFIANAIGTGVVRFASEVKTTSAEQSTSNNKTNATFNVTLNQQPIAQPDGPYQATMNQTLTVNAADGLLKNDTDGNGDTLTAVLDTNSANGNVTVNPDGSFTFVPNVNFFGQTTFKYRASDGIDTSSAATVTIEVDEDNAIPEAANDTYTLAEDTVLNVDAANGVLSNDTDINGDPLTAEVDELPEHGTLTLNSNGSFVYTPDANFFGTDSFTYTATDDNGGEDTATVTLNVTPVNDNPHAENDAYGTVENQALVIDAANGVLVNDSDIENDPLTSTLATQATNGSVNLNSDGSFTYTPNTNFDGIDSFTYTLSDGNGGTDTATVTITVAGVPNPPVANNDSYTTTVNITLIVDAANGVLKNDTDPDSGDHLTVSLDTDVTHGTLTLETDGGFTYVPDAAYIGSDSFTYTVTDSTSNTSSATVSITVTATNHPPVAVDDTYATGQDTELIVDAPGVLANDSDPNGNILSVVVSDDVDSGTLTLNTDGSFTYTPNSGFTGVDTFTYTLSDGQGGTDEGLVTISVNAGNNAPVAADDIYLTNVNTTLSVTALAGVLANDTDADGDTLSAAVDTLPTSGSLTLNTDGSFDYTPNTGFTGVDTFTYTVSDGQGGSDEGTVTINISEVIDLVENGSFENFNDSKLPDDWSAKKITKDKTKCNKPEKTFAYDGLCAFMFKGVPGENSKLVQKPDASILVPGDTVTLYAAIQGKKAVEGRGRVMAKIIYGDEKLKLVITVPSGKTPYQVFKESGLITAAPIKSKVIVQYRVGGNSGKFFVDHVRLIVNDPTATFADANSGLGSSDGERLPLPLNGAIELPPSSLTGSK